MRVKIFISVFLFVGFGEAFLTPKEIEARIQSLEHGKSKLGLELSNLKSSNTKQLNQEVNHLKTQLAGLLESKIDDIEANQTIKNLHVTMEDVQEQAECEYISTFLDIDVIDLSLKYIFLKLIQFQGT